MGKRRVEPEHIQRLRKRSENARDLGLTPRDWAATELGLASFQAQVLASFRPDAQEYVRHAILRTEFEQLESDRRATEVALVTETQLAGSLDSQLDQAVREAHARSAHSLANLNAEVVAARRQLTDLQADELRLTHLVAATRRRCEIVEAENALAGRKAVKP